MSRVAIVDTKLCNLDSIARATEECGGKPFVTSDPSELKLAARIILPGVGAFPAAMAKLNESGLASALTEQVIGQGIPFLGICLGMQLLATRGREWGETDGLGWIDGTVRALEPGLDERVPHVGWNDVKLNGRPRLFEGIPPGRDFYFVHSYVLDPTDREDVSAETDYAGGFVSAVQRGLVFGVQFHPEKSQQVGFQVLRNFLSV